MAHKPKTEAVVIRGLRRAVKSFSIPAGVALLAAVIGGCATQNGQAAKVSADNEKYLHMERAAHRTLWAIADRYCTTTADAYDQLEAVAPTPEAADFALERKLAATDGALDAVMDPNPLVGLMDLAVLTTVYRMTSEAPWFSDLYGGKTDEFLKTLRQQEKEVWAAIAVVLTPSQMAELKNSVEQWRLNHPDQRHVSHVRILDLPVARLSENLSGAPSDRPPGSLFALLFIDPLSSMEPTARQIEESRGTAERVFFYAQRMPALLAYQSELTIRHILHGAMLQQAANDFHTASGSSAQFSAAAAQFARSFQSLPGDLAKERSAAIEQATAQIAAQRDETIRQFQTGLTEERKQAIGQASAEITAQRDETIKQLRAVLADQHATILRDMEAASDRVVDHLYNRLLLVVAFGAVVIGAMSVILRKLPNRRPDHSESTKG